MCRDYKMARLSVHNDDIIKVMKTIIKKSTKINLIQRSLQKQVRYLKKEDLWRFQRRQCMD